MGWRSWAAALMLAAVQPWAGAHAATPARMTAPLPAPAPISASTGRLDATPRIAIVSAFEPEWVTLQQAVAGKRAWTVNGVRFVAGTLGGKPVLLFLSGVSMVNAAMTTQLALDRFRIDRIVFSGVAGGVDPALEVGDVAVPTRWGQYLESSFARAAPGGGFAVAEGIADPHPYANYGMIHPRAVAVRRAGQDRPERRFWFDADPAMLAVAQQVAATITLDRCRNSLCLVKQPKVVVGGDAVSGPVFLDNAEFRQYLSRTFQARAVDMETAAVAQVAYSNAVPYVAFRSLSDLAGGDGGANQARAFYSLASDNSAEVVIALLKALPAR